MDIDITTEPLGTGTDGKPSSCETSGRRRRTSPRVVGEAITSEMYADVVRRRLRRRPTAGRPSRCPAGDAFSLGPRVDLRAQAPVLRRHGRASPSRSPTSPAPRCWPCSATRSPPTTSRPPASSRRTPPPGKYLTEHGVAPKDFNSYGSRRGNHEVMIRGTFANIRLRNQLAPGTEGGVTVKDGAADVDLRGVAGLPGRGHAAGDPGRQGVRLAAPAATGPPRAPRCSASGP